MLAKDDVLRIVLAPSTLILVAIAMPEPSSGATIIYQSVSSSGPVSTSFQPDRLSASADLVASTPDSFLSASVDVSFALSEDAPVRFTNTRTPGRFNGPLARLLNLEFGFALEISYDGSLSLTCGSLPMGDCFALVPAFSPTGAIMPAGDYEFLFNIYAFYHVPGQGSCAVGCGSAGGSSTVLIVPEPTTIALLAAGLGGIALVSRGGERRRSRPGAPDPQRSPPERCGIGMRA
ncbi:MAG TPA: PEP-CTERM sorting domain-containing protein [Myxococcota bacterium]|nr:PEP-CTERM sorting domain-containing protein [Myxococcota bacterium]